MDKDLENQIRDTTKRQKSFYFFLKATILFFIYVKVKKPINCPII